MKLHTFQTKIIVHYSKDSLPDEEFQRAVRLTIMSWWDHIQHLLFCRVQY